MPPNTSATIILACMSVLQLFLGAAALAWAWPLFADPLILGNGLAGQYAELRSLVADNPTAIDKLSIARHHAVLLFEHHHDGLLVALATSFGLILSGAASGLLALWLRHSTRRDARARA